MLNQVSTVVSNQPKTFKFYNHEVRVIEENGKVLFCGKDVALALGYTKPRNAISAHCKGALKRGTLTDGGLQELLYIPEGDVYRLIARSQLESAQEFESWLFDEIVPSVVNTGSYGKSSPEIEMARGIMAAQQLLEQKNEHISYLEQRIEADLPKVLFADSVAASETCILIRELSKLLKQNNVEIGEKRLFEWLRENGYLIRQAGSDYNSPTQRAMDLALFEIKETSITHSDGRITISRTPKITGKGQRYFLNKFLGLEREAA